MTAFRQAYIGGKEWFSQSGLPEDQMGTPQVYARRLSRYIADPSTVRVRTLDQFGKAPTLAVIRDMRQRWLKLVEQRATEQDIFDRPVPPQPVLKLVEAEVPEAPTPAPAPNPTPVAARSFLLRTAADVIDACADVCDVTHGEIVGTMRLKEIVRARNLAAAVLRARGNSLPKVGALLGGRDHSTVVNAIDRFFVRDIREPAVGAAWKALAPCIAKACRTYDELSAVARIRL